MNEVNDPTGAVGPIHKDRKVNDTPCRVGQFRMTVNDCNVAFCDRSAGKGIIQAALYCRGTCENHDTRGGHVQAVDNQGFGVMALDSGAQTVLLVFASTRYRQQTSGFVQYQQGVVHIQDVDFNRVHSQSALSACSSRSKVSHISSTSLGL